jgi:hypothetical protein
MMDQDNLLDYLRKYVANPKLLTLDQLSDADKNNLPENWLDILSVDRDKRLTTVLSHWSNFKDEFEQVVEYIEANLVSVDLIHHGFGFCLLYGIKSANGSRVLYYEGRNPKTKAVSLAIINIWSYLPDKLRSFYDELHNGWYYLASGSMGLSPVEDFFFLDEEDWEILDELGEPPVNLEETLAVYTNGMGGYVCLEFKGSEPHCLLWWSSKPPKLNIDFWPVVDSWTAMGFED